MNHKLLSSLTASLLIAALGVPISSSASSPGSSEPVSESGIKQASIDADPGDTPAQTDSSQSTVAKLDKQSNEVVKVGEQQSQTVPESSTNSVVKVQPHELGGREAATLYVRNLPILTFLGQKKAASDGVKVGTQASSSREEPATAKVKSLTLADAPPKPSLTALLQSSQDFTQTAPNEQLLDGLDAISETEDPVWRATVIAARINQLHRSGESAEKITVTWDSQPQAKSGSDRYVIKTDKMTIAVIDTDTILPNSTRNLESDALQATNRLRRVLGNANPLREVTGKSGPRNGQEISLGPIKMSLTGFASWYGPGFHGNPSASGERFNQHALTAAHRTLPFGTQVLVTNLDNGQTVVVRINDRGPFHGNRVIDLSTAAARVLGLIQSGVAPVRLDVIDPRNASALNN